MRHRDSVPRVGFVIALAAAAMLLAAGGCGTSQPAPPAGGRTGHQPPAGLAGLPGLPAAGVPARSSSAIDYTFTELDEYMQFGASWQDFELTLATAGLSYSILGHNVGATPPVAIRLEGAPDGVWLGLSDYGNNRWLWIDQYFAPAVVDLPEGDFVNGDGMFYAVLACPDGNGTVQTTTLVLPGEPDTDPPEWQGGVGIKTAETWYYDGVISWYPAADALSPPVEYLIYFARSDTGINWDAPQLTVPEGFTDTRFFLGTEEPTSFDFAVRARDALGNTTDNENYLSAMIVEGQALPIVPWAVGDKFVMSATHADLNITFYLLYSGPGLYMEGSPEDHWDLDGLIEFSLDNMDSGLAEEWARVLEVSPPGGYTVEAHIPFGHPDCETVSFRLLDESEQLKHDFGNYTIEPMVGTGFDMAVLARGSWPQDLDWYAGDYFKITWTDPNANLELFIESPSYAIGSPGYPDELAGEIEFSPDSADSGQPEEWARLLPGGWPGVFKASIYWLGYDGDPPQYVTVSMQLLDGTETLKVDLGSVDIPFDDGVDLVAQLHNWPE